MADEPGILTRDAAIRTVAATRWVERRTRNLPELTGPYFGRRTRGPLRGKLDGALAAGGFATVNIWRYDGSDGATGATETVYDWLLGVGESIDAGTEVYIDWFPIDRRWYVTGAKC